MTAGLELEKDIEKTDGVVVNAESSTFPPLSNARKAILLCILCSAQFFDIFNAVSVIIALPDVSNSEFLFFLSEPPS